MKYLKAQARASATAIKVQVPGKPSETHIYGLSLTIPVDLHAVDFSQVPCALESMAGAGNAMYFPALIGLHNDKVLVKIQHEKLTGKVGNAKVKGTLYVQADGAYMAVAWLKQQ